MQKRLSAVKKMLGMAEMILLSFVLSCCINAVYIVFNWEGMLLENVGLHLESFLPEWLCKMTFACATCMGGIYSVLTFLGYYQTIDLRIIAFIPMTICLSTMIHVFSEVCMIVKQSQENELGGTTQF